MADDRGTTAGARSRAGKILAPLAALAAFFALWQAATALLHVNPAILPAPTSIFANIVHQRALLAQYMEPTLVEILLGFGLAIAIGVPIGTLIVFSPAAHRAFYPLIVASQMVPKVAIAPLFVVWVGVGLPSKVLVAFLISFFPIVVSTGQGLAAVDPDMIKLFKSMGASPMRTFVKLRLPVALPSVFSGLKVAMSLAVVGAIVGEFVAANTGLGYYLLFANGQLDTVGVYSALFVLTLLGVVLYFAVEVVERAVVPASFRKSEEELSVTL
ncbi:MAG TPA: ABC transporter permease [Candidatus Dormibacteraeota bacterium]|nr:ABC transporter permease [Candidatus Dormibacteraeota bacterium]